MTLQASGPISFSQIANEFGTPTGRNLGAYQVSQSVGNFSNLPLDTGIPQSGSIAFSNFYSKKLNVVVDLYSIPNFSQRLSARVRYNNQNVIVIGGFKSRPASSSGTRVIINVDRIIGSDLGSIDNVALTTGGWESDTALELEIGPSGQLYGAGGNGGKGADSQTTNSTAGGSGSSALGIQYPTIVRNGGYIQSGGGGGGGGSWTNFSRRTGSITRRRTEIRSNGSGGGGGSGFPSGSGGAAGTGGRAGNPGGGGSLTGGGVGGAIGGDTGSGNTFGGAGGSSGNSGSSGGGKGGGSQGRAIIIYNDGSGTSISNIGGSIAGPTIYNTNPT